MLRVNVSIKMAGISVGVIRTGLVRAAMGLTFLDSLVQRRAKVIAAPCAKMPVKLKTLLAHLIDTVVGSSFHADDALVAICMAIGIRDTCPVSDQHDSVSPSIALGLTKRSASIGQNG